ncbi:MAG: FAD-dependent oxidoreductase [Pseudomonadota bacterium]
MKKQRVVIIGGGFGGAFTARALSKIAKDQIEVEIINRTNYFVFQPLLPEVAAGTINASDAVTPLRVLLPNTKVRMADVTHIDTDNKRLTLLQGRKLVPITLEYDHLVIASGLKADLSFLPGFEEHSFSMKDLADAHGLRNHVIQCLEHADVTQDAELKKELLTFVVAGGGFSGVETIGEMSEMIARTLRYYPNIKHSELRGILVQKAGEVLPELPPVLGSYARKELAKRHIDVLLDMGIESATGTAVTLSDGTVIPTRTLVTTVGNGPTELMHSLPVELARGRLQTNRHLQVLGLKDVWAVGDVASIPLSDDEENQSFAPPTAQFAVREAKFLAKTILASMDDRPLNAFEYEPRGSMASIGHYKAVAQVFKFKLSGLFAWILWRAFYISMVPSLSTRLRIALNWMFDYVLPRKIVQIQQKSEGACRHKRYAKGDVVFEPGQLVDGFYTIVAGALEATSVDPSTGEEHVRVLGPGDHWGERTLAGDLKAVGYLRAIKDSDVRVFPREDFGDLRSSFPIVNEYFARIHDSVYPVALRQKKGGDNHENTEATKKP